MIYNFICFLNAKTNDLQQKDMLLISMMDYLYELAAIYCSKASKLSYLIFEYHKRMMSQNLFDILAVPLTRSNEVALTYLVQNVL